MAATEAQAAQHDQATLALMAALARRVDLLALATRARSEARTDPRVAAQQEGREDRPVRATQGPKAAAAAQEAAVEGPVVQPA